MGVHLRLSPENYSPKLFYPPGECTYTHAPPGYAYDVRNLNEYILCMQQSARGVRSASLLNLCCVDVVGQRIYDNVLADWSERRLKTSSVHVHSSYQRDHSDRSTIQLTDCTANFKHRLESLYFLGRPTSDVLF